MGLSDSQFRGPAQPKNPSLCVLEEKLLAAEYKLFHTYRPIYKIKMNTADEIILARKNVQFQC